MDGFQFGAGGRSVAELCLNLRALCESLRTLRLTRNSIGLFRNWQQCIAPEGQHVYSTQAFSTSGFVRRSGHSDVLRCRGLSAPPNEAEREGVLVL
jgi:hypothetical protein